MKIKIVAMLASIIFLTGCSGYREVAQIQGITVHSVWTINVMTSSELLLAVDRDGHVVAVSGSPQAGLLPMAVGAGSIVGAAGIIAPKLKGIGSNTAVSLDGMQP